MFSHIGRFAVRRRRLVLAASLVFMIGAAALGVGVFGRLSGGGFDDPASPSTQAKSALAATFKSGEPNLVLLAQSTGSVDGAAATTAGNRILTELRARKDVRQAESYWSLGRVAPLKSKDGTAALIVVRIGGNDIQQQDSADAIAHEFGGRQGPLTVSAGGQQVVFSAVSHQIKDDLARAESFAVPITLLLLILIFGGLVAAGLPLVVGLVAVLGTFFTLWVVTLFTDVSVFSINLVTAMGLGLAIDYSLFIVSRYREELRAGKSSDDAVVRTVETAGRTVAVSALTVGVSLSALLVFPLYFLRSFAYAGAGVTLVSALASVLTLPALLSVLGERVNKFQIIRHKEPALDGGFWHRLATGVMKRPWTVAITVIVILLAFGAPFLGVKFGTPDQRVLPSDNAARVATDRIASEFASNESNAFPVVAMQAGAASDATVNAYAATLSTVKGVTRVDAPTGRFIDGQKVTGVDNLLVDYRVGNAVRYNVVPGVLPISDAGENMVHDIRDLKSPLGPVLVGGSSAQLVDSKAAIASRLPLAGGIIALATFVLLFLMFGSIVVPLKAIVLNILSLTATFGAMVWIFQDGHGAGLLGFSSTGMTDTTTPILMFCIAFGLSMDYEVFLLSRIKEEHDRTGDNTASVALGLERTGRIVTAAAALLAITFLSFATSGITFIKLFGLGLTLAVVMDATLIRATLVPAFMKLAGEANWWAPKWMKAIYNKIGFSESDGPADYSIGSPDDTEADRIPVGIGP
jgi:RND superfamily putative drug exporter